MRELTASSSPCRHHPFLGCRGCGSHSCFCMWLLACVLIRCACPLLLHSFVCLLALFSLHSCIIAVSMSCLSSSCSRSRERAECVEHENRGQHSAYAKNWPSGRSYGKRILALADRCHVPSSLPRAMLCLPPIRVFVAFFCAIPCQGTPLWLPGHSATAMHVCA